MTERQPEEASGDHLPSDAARTLGHKLRIDVAACQVVASLAAAGIPSLLIKGPALQRLYEDELRGYGDVDLLVPATRATAAEELLVRQGCTLHYDEDVPNEAWRAHVWQRPDGVVVDLHQNIEGVRARPELTWEVLSRGSVALSLAGGEVAVPSDPSVAVIVALHAIQHGARWTRPQEDLRRAVRVLPLETWQEAAARAADLAALVPFSSALQLVEGGPELVATLRLPRAPTRAVAMSLADDKGMAMSLERVAATAGVRAKVALVGRELWPPPDVMRVSEPRAARGRAWLVLAYVVRPFRLAVRLPGALRVWLRVRREVGRGPDG